MSARLQFAVGTLLLALGVALAAGAGSRLGGVDFDAARDHGITALGGAPATVRAPVAQTPLARLAAWSDDGLGPFLSGLLIMLGGGLLARRARRDGTAGLVAGLAVDWPQTLTRLHAEVDGLRNTLAAATLAQLPQVRAALESIQTDLVEPLVESRGTLEVQFGLAGHASVMAPLSGAERLLARTWSALVDRHAPEAAACLEHALAAVENAQAAYSELARTD